MSDGMGVWRKAWGVRVASLWCGSGVGVTVGVGVDGNDTQRIK